MVLGMATGSIMISGKGDHYFDESNELVGCNKSRYCEFFVIDCANYCGWEPGNIGLKDDGPLLHPHRRYRPGMGGVHWQRSFIVGR